MAQHKHPQTILFHAITRNKKFSVSNYPNYLPLLSSFKDLNSLLQVHARLIVSGFQNNHFTNTHFIKSYLSFKKYDFARFLIDFLPIPSVRLYNSIIRAFTGEKHYHEAIKSYHFMLNNGIEPDKYTFTFVLKACSGVLDFEEGISIHRDIVSRGLDCDVFIGTALVDMYGKMGNLGLAREVFDKMPVKDVTTWNAMILCLSQSVDPEKALGFIWHMQLNGLEPDLVSIVNLVPAVSGLGDFDACRSIHGYVIRRRFEAMVSNGLIDMYSKCRNINVAGQVFERMQNRDDISWQTMMAGYAHNECFFEVLELFDCMKRESVRLNNVSIVNALLAAAETRDTKKGTEIYDFARELQIDSDVSVATAVITMYVKFGDLDKAKTLFRGLKVRDLVAWSAIISAFVQSGYPEDALLLFRDMQNDSLKANNVTLMSVLPACAELSALRLGKSMHCYVIKADMDLDISIGTALVSVYAKCGFFASALTIFNRMPFKDIVTWNVLINGYNQIGDPYHAMEIFIKAQTSEICADSGTLVGLLSACVLLCDIDQGSCIHGQIIKYGLESHSHVKNALIDMYSKCGRLSAAEFLFKSMEFRNDEVSWNTMIAGYLYNGHAIEAISTFCQMKLEDFNPNLVTIVSVLPAVGHLSALKEGTAFHAFIIQIGFQSNILVGNCLIDMYAKCGQLHISEKLFHEMRNKSIVSWNVMLAAYATHGHGHCAIELFSLMEKIPVRIDSLSFVSVLSACRHAGLIDEGRKIFYSMQKKYQLEPGLEHYACMVDLLGRAGLFEEIVDLIKAMPLEPDATVWGALLGASKIHSHVQLAELAAEHLVKLDPDNATHHVVLSNIYSKYGRWEDAVNTRSKMIRTGLKKIPGWSWV